MVGNDTQKKNKHWEELWPFSSPCLIPIMVGSFKALLLMQLQRHCRKDWRKWWVVYISWSAVRNIQKETSRKRSMKWNLIILMQIYCIYHVGLSVRRCNKFYECKTAPSCMAMPCFWLETSSFVYADAFTIPPINLVSCAEHPMLTSTIAMAMHLEVGAKLLRKWKSRDRIH